MDCAPFRLPSGLPGDPRPRPRWPWGNRGPLQEEPRVSQGFPVTASNEVISVVAEIGESDRDR